MAQTISVTYRGYDHAKDQKIRALVTRHHPAAELLGAGTDFVTRDMEFELGELPRPELLRELQLQGCRVCQR